MFFERFDGGRFLQDFETFRAFLLAKQVNKKRGEFQNPVKNVHIQVVLIIFPLIVDDHN